jgi:hypothetical protein
MEKVIYLCFLKWSFKSVKANMAIYLDPKNDLMEHGLEWTEP